MNPELSCIIITLNEEKALPNLLTSLKNQTYQNFETIVADYNSKDKTREIAKKFRCKITKGGGYSAGRNNGAKIAKGKYLLFLDADSTMSKDFLEVNMKEFKTSKKGVGTVEVKPISNRYFDKIFFKFYDIWSKLMLKISPHCAGCGIFVKKNVFKKLNGFDEKIVFAENHDFTRRAKPYGFIILPRHMYTSVRRMDKEGRFVFIIKYIYSGIYRLIYKEIDRKLFEYNNKR
ncbi:MAG: glycosyltransferase [Candidatus Pacearchaeota archaeon]